MPPARGPGPRAPAVRLTPSRTSRVLLVGFMGSGKSAVGRRLARVLEWRFVDMDAEVEAEAGRSVAEIFREEGEARFRELEVAAARRLLELDRVVIASGGGWPCAPGRLEEVPRGTLTIWLRVSPAEAVKRIRSGRTPRPLLEVDDPLRRARELLGERERFYRKAHWKVQTDGRSPGAVAGELGARIDADRTSR